MGKKNANNDGSIRKRANGTWEGRYTDGYNDAGRQIQRSVYGKTRKEVADKIRDVLVKKQSGTYIAPSQYRLGDWMIQWLQTYAKNAIKPSTYISYEGYIYNHINPCLGGHPDTAQGAKCTIVIAPLLQGRIPAICTDVTTVTTPGESVDIVVTDYGVAVNPARPDLLKALQDADCVPLKTIEELRDIAYSIVGEPDKVQFGDRVVGIIEARDGTIMDVVREVKPFSFRED